MILQWTGFSTLTEYINSIKFTAALIIDLLILYYSISTKLISQSFNNNS